jgi:hypothetical protein
VRATRRDLRDSCLDAAIADKLAIGAFLAM